jgi:hypothetical protein
MRSCNFWRLMFDKVTSRSYSYFLKFSFFFLEKRILPNRLETAKIGQKNKRNFRG